MTDWRALCAELAHEVEQYAEDRGDLMPECAERARAALAEPVAAPAGPSLEEVEELCEEHCFNVEGYESTECLQGLINDALARWGHQPAPPAEGDVAELALKELERTVVLLMPVTGHKKIKRFDTIRAALKRLQVLENKADLSPAPVPAEGEVAELVALIRQISLAWEPDACLLGNMTAGQLTRTAYLLEQRHPEPVPAGMIPVEYWDIDSGARIVTEPSEEAPGGCWVVLNSRHVNPLTEFPTAKAAWNALQQAHALPLPAGEVE